MTLEKRDKEALKGYHSLFLILGIVMAVFGAILIIFPLVGSFVIELLLGITLLVTGIIGIVTGAVSSSRWKGSTFVFLNGIIALIFGLLLLFYPYAGVVTLALLMGVLLIIQGFFEIGKSSHLRSKGWKNAILTDGIFCIIIGFLVLVGWPSDSVWVIGLLVGITLLVTGLISICFASAVKKHTKR